MLTEQSLNTSKLLTYRLLSLTPEFFEQVVFLANKIHGESYLDIATLAQWVKQGCCSGKNASVIAVYQDQILGYRISFAAGQWQTDVWCSTDSWPIALTKMAYFKSVAVQAEWQGQGIGQALLQQSICILKEQGAQAGLAHLWRESPHNSAVRYFSKAGGQLIRIHENRWQHLSAQGYICPRCTALCCCSAAEMVLLF